MTGSAAPRWARHSLGHCVLGHNDEKSGRNDLPRVSVVIAAYNEERSIGQKIENTLGLDYPKELMEIIVASDCSSDKTDEIARNYGDRGVKLSRMKERSGKTAAQNEAAKIAGGEILLFSDATTIYDRNAIKKIVPNFADSAVGCVGGRLIFHQHSEEKRVLPQKNLYELLEQYIRTEETRIWTTFGIDGCIYAVRKELYKPLDRNLTSDFVIPLMIIRDGYRVVFERHALAHEELPPFKGYELKRKIRTVRVGLTGMFAMRKLLNPLRYGFWIPFGLISHKVFRWLSPFFLMGLALTNFFLLKEFPYNVFFGIQVLFYGLAAAGVVLNDKLSSKIVSLPLYFCLLNMAAVFCFIEFIKGKRTEIWDTARN
jgi:cellulose synthase/poly-beta-1,6-N-acetylglucosamine synthase-like glycosyltransferase